MRRTLTILKRLQREASSIPKGKHLLFYRLAKILNEAGKIEVALELVPKLTLRIKK